MPAVPKKKVALKVNGLEQVHEVEPRLLLVDFLRDIVGLTGTHVGCDTSICGACTVMLDGSAVKSCTLLAVQANGAELLTIEGWLTARDFIRFRKLSGRCHGLQCGFCTPGTDTRRVPIAPAKSQPTEKEIRHSLDGNLCRCTGYQHIVDAVRYGGQADGK